MEQHEPSFRMACIDVRRPRWEKRELKQFKECSILHVLEPQNLSSKFDHFTGVRLRIVLKLLEQNGVVDLFRQIFGNLEGVGAADKTYENESFQDGSDPSARPAETAEED